MDTKTESEKQEGIGDKFKIVPEPQGQHEGKGMERNKEKVWEVTALQERRKENVGVQEMMENVGNKENMERQEHGSKGDMNQNKESSQEGQEYHWAV